MPSLFIPRRSDAHRLACLALYKALLRQCGRLPLGPPSSASPRRLSPLQELVRHRFRRDRRLQSFLAIQNALEHGRVQLQVLHDANRGSTAAREALIKTIEATASHAESEAEARQVQRLQATEPPARARPQIVHLRNQRTKSMQQPPPGSVPLTALPLPLSQHKRPRRTVPYLNEAQGRAAILRWPGQHRFPVYVSRVMRQKIKRFEEVHEKRMDLEYYVKLGEFEDAWDSIIERQVPLEQQQQQQQQEPRPALSWSSAAAEALVVQEALVRRIEAERGARGRLLWGIVKKEQKLSDWETLPERVVRAAKKMAGIHLDLVRLAKRWGKHDLAARLFTTYQKRRRANAKTAVDLASMYWVIPVEWVKNIQPLTLADESTPLPPPTVASLATATATTITTSASTIRNKAVREGKQESRLQHRPHPRAPPRPRRTALPPSHHPRREGAEAMHKNPRDYGGYAFKKALDTVKLIDVGKQLYDKPNSSNSRS